MNRRDFLKGATAAGLVGLAGCPALDDEPDETSPSPAPAETPTEVTPGTSTQTPDESTPEATPTPSPYAVDTSDMTEVTADVSPGDEVSDVVSGIGSGELLVFPPERFRWESRSRVLGDDWGIRCHEDTVFEVPPGIGDGEKATLLATHSGNTTADNFLLENLTFDSPGRAAPGLHLAVRNTAHVSGLRYEMNGPTSNQMHENGVRAYTESADGTLYIDDYQQYNNGDLGGYGQGDSRIGVWVGPKNDGTVHLRNPVLQGFPNNACYVSRQPGNVIIEGGHLVNNNVSAVRVSGGVTVRGTTITIDIDRYLEGPGVLEGPAHNTRGVWGDNHGAGTDGGLVTNTRIVLKSFEKSYGLAAILRNRQMTVRDSQFVLDADIASVQAERGEIAVENCDFGGSSSGSTAGVGNISGSGNCVSRFIKPGDVPVASRCFVCARDLVPSGAGLCAEHSG